jgi:ligand-binding sensor domain-containing protein/signal transduction histidine kinase
VILLLWLAIISGGSAGTGFAGGFTVDTWTTKQGLPQDSVISLTQTRDGYLWLATLNGLVRFDGVRFTVFDESNTPELNNSRIVKVFEDSQTNLWVGTETAGVVLVEPSGAVTGVDVGRGNVGGGLMSIAEDKSGAIWLYTAKGELCRYYAKKVDVRAQVKTTGTMDPSICRALAVDNSGLLWVATDWSLAGLQPPPPGPAAGLPVAYEVPVGKLDFILPSRQGGCWQLADGRIVRRVNERIEADLGPYPWTNVPVAAACEDDRGQLIVGTYGAGVYWHNPDGGWQKLMDELSHSFIFSLVFDREGSLWVGTDGGGLNRVKRQTFSVVPGSGDFAVKSVCSAPGGTVWFGINNGGLAQWREGVLDRLLGNLPVRTVLIDRGGQLWVGTGGDGLFTLTNNLFQRAPGSENLDRFVSCLFEDHRGRLWVGTQKGLACWDGEKWLTLSNSLSASSIKAIAEDGQGSMWIGTSAAGLSHLRDGKVTVFGRTNGLPSNNIASLLFDKQGTLWVGTANGLARLSNGAWTHFSTDNGLPVSNLGYLVEDELGFLWAGSYAGLVRIGKQALAEYVPGANKPLFCRLYGEPDGLGSGACSEDSQPGAHRSADGRLWFPTSRGLVTVDPKAIAPNTNPPPVIIEAVLLDGRPQTTNTLRVPPPQKIIIPPGKEGLDIQFACLNLAAPEKSQISFRMFRHENTWTRRSGSIRSVHYTKMPPGEYQFQVVAANEDGVRNEVGATLAVIVLPPFWRTWWFLSIVTVLVLGAVAGIVHSISTQRLQHQLAVLRQKEALENERARIARDIHDQVGASLTQVSLIGEMLEADKDLPDEVEAHARQISQTALETTRALDEIVWTVNPSNDTLDGLINYVCKYAQEYLAVAGVRYRLEVPSPLPNTSITPELRHNVFLAAKEAVTNVVKHARATSASIRLRLEPSRFTLEIEDNGRGLGGMDPKAAAARNGLRNMRKRMEDVGGSFAIEPGSEGGAVVKLSAPVSGS